MTDIFTKEKRSENMSHICGKNTSIELEVRRYLFSLGFRYRVNKKELPGKPDIVMQRYSTVIFVNGCFWHHHKNCKLAYIPKTNTEFWTNKFAKNMKNDKKHSQELRKMGYHVITIWECKLKKDFNKEMNRVVGLLHKYSENCQ